MGLLTILWDEEILERGETRRDGDELFRVKVVGSTPAGPTTPFTHSLNLVKFTFQFLIWMSFVVDRIVLTAYLNVSICFLFHGWLWEKLTI